METEIANEALKINHLPAGLFAFLSIGLLSSLWRYRTRQHLLHSVIGLMMAYSARFFNLTAFLLAKESEGSEVMWVFIYLLFFVATVRVLQGEINVSMYLCTCTRMSCGISLMQVNQWHTHSQCRKTSTPPLVLSSAPFLTWRFSSW